MYLFYNIYSIQALSTMYHVMYHVMFEANVIIVPLSAAVAESGTRMLQRKLEPHLKQKNRVFHQKCISSEVFDIFHILRHFTLVC